GNNTIGRADTNRIAIDFGDESISKEEQAYIRYDNEDRSFLLVPNLTKTNVIAHNETRPAQPVPLNAMDLITMGRTQLVFVPFCGPDFDWGELSELNR
ncbi:MAG: FHA domain-containing protein, partial [Pseudomonadota bacterium]